VDPGERRIELLHHLAERSHQGRPPPDEHIIVAGTQLDGWRYPHNFPQSPAHPIAFHGIADLARHGETDADGTFVIAQARLQNESTPGSPCAARYGLKIAAALEPLDNGGTGPITH
jgi:hypothetical protein